MQQGRPGTAPLGGQGDGGGGAPTPKWGGPEAARGSLPWPCHSRTQGLRGARRLQWGCSEWPVAGAPGPPPPQHLLFFALLVLEPLLPTVAGLVSLNVHLLEAHEGGGPGICRGRQGRRQRPVRESRPGARTAPGQRLCAGWLEGLCGPPVLKAPHLRWASRAPDPSALPGLTWRVGSVWPRWAHPRHCLCPTSTLPGQAWHCRSGCTRSLVELGAGGERGLAKTGVGGVA